jgi:spore coat protein A
MSLRTTIRAVGLATAVLALSIAAQSQVLLDPGSQPKFVNSLPIAARVDATAGGYLEIEARQVQQHLGLYDPVTGAPLMTTVWGYNGTYPGPTLVVRSNVPLDVKWTNGLVGPGGPLPHLLPVDTSVHWAMPDNWPACGVPLVTHVHGGHAESASDGLPDAWFTPGFAQTGPGFVKQTLHYDNDQEAGIVWYHDHALGITRLNVYAGLAGFYLIRDANEDALVAAHQLPTGPYEIEMAIQDKMFTASGALFYPSTPDVVGAPDPSHLPEFFGDVILVNGAAWPYLDVEPRQYRFRMLDGSDSRFYELRLVEKGKPLNDSSANAKGAVGTLPLIYQIGTEDGLLNAPVPVTKFLLGTGERKDIVIDFSNPALRGKTFVLRNNARAPFPKGETVDPNTTGQIMSFRVRKPLDTSVYPLTALPANLRPVLGPVAMPVPNAGTRGLILFEGTDEYGRLRSRLGTLEDGPLAWHAPITENPMLNDTEVWEVYNLTEDAHPIHLHLVSFRVLDRQKFTGDVDEDGKLTNIHKVGQPIVPGPDEAGWKDTVVMYPDEVTRIVATFSREGLYVWHCHILSHEDHEMMRPYYVGPMASMQSALAVVAHPVKIESVYPNPFNPSVTIRFALKTTGRVDATVYDVTGRPVSQLAHRSFTAGSHELRWNGETDRGGVASTGVYFLRIHAGNEVMTRRLVLLK